jgi:hypothetical protein
MLGSRRINQVCVKVMMSSDGVAAWRENKQTPAEVNWYLRFVPVFSSNQTFSI